MTMIYLDYAATTPMSKEALSTYCNVAESTIGNPSSLHGFGRRAKKVLNTARQTVAQALSVMPKQIIFTSGGTEADNLALFGIARGQKKKGTHLITTQIEHQAVLQSFKQLEQEGFEVTYLAPDKDGKVTVEQVEAAIRPETILVSIMTGNNETGVLQPIHAIGQRLKESSIHFHTDAVQAFGMIPIDCTDWQVDSLSISSHKISGPKGVGALYIKEPKSLERLQVGGNQEFQLRGGTENLPAIAAFATAIEQIDWTASERFKSYEQQLLLNLEQYGIDYQQIGCADKLNHITAISFPNVPLDLLLMKLDMKGVAISSGSACTAGSVTASHVLEAMFGQGSKESQHTVRLSYGVETTSDEIEKASHILASVVKEMQMKEKSESND